MKATTVLELAIIATCMGAAASAFAGERSAAPMLPAYRQDCSACHTAYPRSMLPSSSWQRIMSNLSSHFGTDASIDEAQLRQISGWLQAAPERQAPPEDRITRSTWFVHEHAEVPAAVWKRASVKSASNCTACHVQADKGVFNEHDVRIPR